MLEKILQRSTFSIPMQSSISDVLDQLGSPIKENNASQYLVLQFSSISAVKADYLYFENDVLVKKSLSLRSDEKTVGDFISAFGEPKISRRQYSSDVDDSLQLTVHIWPKSGITTISNGAEMSSLVLRADEFTPLSLDEYYEKWEPRLAANEEITIQTIPYEERLKQQYEELAQTTPQERPITFLNDLMNTRPNWTVLGIVLSVLIIVFGVTVQTFLWKKRKQKKNNLDESLEH